MRSILIIAGFSVAALLSCGRDNLAGNSSQEANARGTLVKSDGAPAYGVQVYLRPSDYLSNAFAKLSARHDFRTMAVTTTDSAGKFSFDSIAAGSYMLECLELEGNTGAQIALVMSSVDMIAEIPTDTLKLFGSIAGQIQLPESLDASRVRVLVYGLDRVITPDSSGAFVIGNLPEGKYDLHIIGSDLTLDLRGGRGASVTAGQTATLPPSLTTLDENGLVGYWPFDENAGQYAYDASGNGNNGRLGASASLDSMDPVWTSGKIGACMQFDSINNTRVSVVIANSSLESLSTFTYTAWINPTGYGNYGRIVSREFGNDTLNEFYVNLVGGDWQNLGAGIVDTNGGHFTSNSDSSTIALNSWQHMAVTYDDAGDRMLHLFINGAEVSYLDSSGIVSAALRMTSNPLTIGNRDLYNRAFVGKIDELKIYNRVLSLGEIQTEMNRQ